MVIPPHMICEVESGQIYCGESPLWPAYSGGISVKLPSRIFSGLGAKLHMFHDWIPQAISHSASRGRQGVDLAIQWLSDHLEKYTAPLATVNLLLLLVLVLLLLFFSWNAASHFKATGLSQGRDTRKAEGCCWDWIAFYLSWQEKWTS